eukprot:4503688-Heterocapsa_arctica.AAC.1
MRQVINEHHLVCSNTWIATASGPTYTDGFEHLTRIDYVILPRDYLPNIDSMTVHYRKARLIQWYSSPRW